MLLPRCCPDHRLDALDRLDALVANDVAAMLDTLIGDDWPLSHAADAVDGYRQWLHDRLDDAITFGADAWATTHVVDR